jgi:heme-degrading monooxygenase HmoA
MITDSRASLAIYSATHTAAEVTRVLGIEPAESAENGDPKHPPRVKADGTLTKQYFYTTSYWQLDVPSQGDGFSSLLALADLLAGKEAALEKLRETHDTVIWYFGSSDSEQAGFVIPPEVVAKLGPLGCEIDFDIYLSSQDSLGQVIEKTVLPVKAGMESEFEAAFEKAALILKRVPGFADVALARGVEKPNTYLLLIGWDSVESHEIGFRQSPEYQEWKALLHHFYDPFPTVEHFIPIHSASV